MPERILLVGVLLLSLQRPLRAEEFPIWRDPQIRQFIDEWLQQAHLNRWGQWTGTHQGAVVSSNGPLGPEDRRHEILWKMFAAQRSNAPVTLAGYIAARTHGTGPRLRN